MDIYELLAQEHKKIAEFLNEIKILADINITYYHNKIKILYREMYYQISSHVQREEKIFYDRLEKNELLFNFIRDIEKDHFIIEYLLKELYLKNNIDKIWMRKFNRLYCILSAHTKLEEDQIFKRAKKILSNEEAKKLGEQFLKLNIVSSLIL